MIRIRLLSTLSLCFGVLLAPDVRGDTVVLKNKASYTGRITAETPNSLRIHADGADWDFPRDKIASIKRDKAEAARAATSERAREKEMARERKATKKRVAAEDAKAQAAFERHRQEFRQTVEAKKVKEDREAREEAERKKWANPNDGAFRTRTY